MNDLLQQKQTFGKPKTWALIAADGAKVPHYYTWSKLCPDAICLTCDVSEATKYESESHAQTAAIILERKGFGFFVHNTEKADFISLSNNSGIMLLKKSA